MWDFFGITPSSVSHECDKQAFYHILKKKKRVEKKASNNENLVLSPRTSQSLRLWCFSERITVTAALRSFGLYNKVKLLPERKGKKQSFVQSALQRYTEEGRRQLQSSDEEHSVSLCDFIAVRRCVRKPVLTWLLSLAAPSQASLVGICLHILFFLIVWN